MTACEVASLHCRYDLAILSDYACVKHIEYGDEVDIAFIAGFASCAASLHSRKHEMVAEVRLEFFQERFAPLFGIYHGVFAFLICHGTRRFFGRETPAWDFPV